MARETYAPDLASFDAGFPPSMPAPPLLRAFAAWLSGVERSSLGWFHVESQPLPAAFAQHDDATAALRAQLGIFMRLPNGGLVALWRHTAAEPPAVVLLGPKRELRELAPDLETFLATLARADTGISALDRHSGTAGETLASWLAERAVRTREPAADAERFARWVERTVEASQRSTDAAAGSQPPKPDLPSDLFARVDPLIGLLTDDARVARFFDALGVQLDAVRSPERLRLLAYPESGVAFSILWPWEQPSEWRDAEYPAARRAELERTRTRMLWSVDLFVAAESRAVPATGERHMFQPFRGLLPFGIRAGEDVEALEAKLGSPMLGRYGQRTWDFPDRARSLVAGVNEGALIRTELPRGAVTWLRWQRRQSL